MDKTIQEFFDGAQDGLMAFQVWSDRFAPSAVADHICYKCADLGEFEQVRALFEKDSEFIYQSIISHRRIAYIKFLQPIQTLLGEIHYLELADQKPDGSQTSGFDHIEIYPLSGTVEEFVADLASKGMMFEKIERPHHTTFDATITGTFKVRIEPEVLIEKIKREEMR
ncbi:hypothetical protein EXS71_00920 [Candidatus Uhrbacteria bacterium]|nr:hypothetical protein [Candidatus Uhrbacteria bacterium]